MFTVSIPKIVTRPTKLVDKKTGAFVDEQLLVIEHPDMFTPVQAAVLLQDHQQPHAVGRYHLAPESIEAGEYGRPSFKVKIGKLIK